MPQDLAKLLQRSGAWLEAGRNAAGPGPDPGSGPRELHFELTYSCNQRCLMCDIWPRYRRDPELKKEELTFEEIRTAVEESRLLDRLELILFSGGEPFLRPDLARLVSYFAGRYPSARLAILSNFFDRSLIVDTLAEIFRNAPRAKIMLGTSLDGLGEKHDLIRGVPGAFAGFRLTLAEVRRLFPAVTVETNFTITPKNFDQLLPVHSFTREEGIGFTAQFPIPWAGTEDLPWNPGELERAGGEIRRVMEAIHRDNSSRFRPAADSLLIRLQYLEGMLDYERSPRRIFPRCPAPSRYAMFSPRGDLYFCPKLKEMTAGNLRRDPFDRLWLGEKAKRIREHIDSGRCHCWLNCTTYLNIAEALERGMPPGRRRLLAAGKILYRGYRRALPLALRIAAFPARAAVYFGAFLYLSVYTAGVRLRRRARIKGSPRGK